MLQEHHLKADVLKDQHFCSDENVLRLLIKTAQLEKKDTVLEIGPGLGILTAELARQTQKVIALELDQKFQPVLKKLPRNVEVIFGNALDLLPQQKCSKIVSNLPYQICEPFLHYLCLANDVTRTVVTVPKTFALKAQKHPFFSAFLTIELLYDVPKESFYPRPKVLSAIIIITRNRQTDFNTLLRQKMYLQRDKKVKNGLRDALIEVYGYHHRPLTKNQARDVITKLNLPTTRQEIRLAKLPLQSYREITATLETFFEQQ